MDLTPENQQKINDVLGYLLDSVQKVGDVAVDQLPLVAQEIALWGFWSNAIVFGLIAVAFLIPATTFACCLLSKKTLNDEHYNLTGTGVVAIAAGIATILLGGALLVTTITPDGPLQQAIKASVAPRVYVIDWLRGK